MKVDTKNEMIKVRVTKQEKEHLKKLANTQNQTLSAYILEQSLRTESDYVDTLSNNNAATSKYQKPTTSNNMNEIIIYTDGSCKGNPGPGGYGVIIKFVDDRLNCYEKTASAGYFNTTNNRMEVMAAIVGLEILTRPCKVTIVSDSTYLVDAFRKNWIKGWVDNGWKTGKGDPVKNSDLWKRLLKVMGYHDVSFKWIKGHDGHPENERCDDMAVEAAEHPEYEDKIDI